MAKKQKISEDRTETAYIKNAKSRFFQDFAKETEAVRTAIVRDLPAYNALLNINATTFDEMVLLQVCEEKGLPPHLASTLVPKCPYCGSDEYVGRKEAGIYRCKFCSTPLKEVTFAPNFNSISTDSRKEAITWMQLLQCMLSYIPMTQAVKLIGISETTYFRMRNKVFYAMRLLLDGLEDGSGEYGVKLYGNIEVDNCYTRVSFKGMQLEYESDLNDFTEDSMFFDDTFILRSARGRGGPNKMSERGLNSATIFSAIDDRGRVMVRYAGTGATSLRLLKQYIPEGKILKEVPNELPFEKIAKNTAKEPASKPGDRTLIIADKEPALKSYAEHLGVDFEAHVYRKNGVQWQLAEGHHDIQRVNALHSRLKNHLRRCGYVSTKYLPGLLTQFEFVENFDQELAIKELFKILTKPHLGKPPKFYQTLFTVPDFLEEWLASSSALRKFPYNKLLAFYLYDHIRRSEEYPDIVPGSITMDDIEEATGYARTTIRRFYAALDKAGYRQKILDYFGEPIKVQKNKKIILPKPPQKKGGQKHYTINYPPVVYSLYDDYIENFRGVPKALRRYRSADEWRLEANKKHGTDYSYENLMSKFSHIRESGFRPELPKIDVKQRYGESITHKKASVLLDYEELERHYRQKGEKPPSVLIMRTQIGQQYGYSQSAIRCILSAARAYRKRHPKEFARLAEEIKKERASEQGGQHEPS